MLDIDYSIERHLFANWTATPALVQAQSGVVDVSRDQNWVEVYVLYVTGLPSRAGDYGARLLVTANLFSRDSRRVLMRTVEAWESFLRKAHVAIYDESDKTTVRGYIKFTEPALKRVSFDGGVWIATVDTEALVYF